MLLPTFAGAMYLQVNSVRMRRHLNSKDFKGSIFLEFEDEETAEKVFWCIEVL